MAHSMDDFTKGIKALLTVLNSILEFKIYINELPRNQGRIAEIRELSLQIDTNAVNKISWAISIWDNLPDEVKISYYHQAVQYIEQMKALDDIALAKLAEFTRQNNLNHNNMPDLILLAWTTHKRLLEMNTSLHAMIAWLEIHKPENTAHVPAKLHGADEILDPQLNSDRKKLIARL